MSELMLQKWDCVIVDWVNCLEIVRHIQNINSLKSGEFFKALLDLLQPDLPTSLSEFLRTNYPKFELCSEDKRVEDYSDPELTAIASLLLHYTCIPDRRESLVAPLCQKLNAGVQTYIRYFLEHFSQDTSAVEFNDVVRKAIGHERHGDRLCVTPKAMEWNSSGESPFVCNSPLYEYFKTPAAKTAKMQEKDREIRRLHQELQLERDEKEDLHVEIREHKQRIKKIASEVHEKSVIISNLSARLADLEERPPNNKSRELFEIEKLLRTELADAQQYICELQSEHGELSLQRQEISKKLATSQETSCVWQERAVQFECKLDEALAKYKFQREELTNLQINYNELSTLLDELRQNKANASSVDLEVSSSPNVENKTSVETLADTVVEIQLKECQMEMQELQIKLADQVQYSTEVDKQLQNTVQELAECRRSFKELGEMKHDVDVTLDKYILTNEKLETKINQIAKDYSELSERNGTIQDLLTASVEKSQKLEDDVLDLKGQLDDVNNNQQKLESRNEELLEQVTLLQKSEQSLLDTNAKIVQQVETMTNESALKGVEISSLKAELLEHQETLQESEKLVESLKKDLEETFQARDEFEEKLAHKNCMFGVLEEEARHLQQKYEESVDAFTTSEFNLEALHRQIKESDNKMQVNIDRLEEFISGSLESSHMEKIERVELLLDKLASKQTSFENRIELLKQLNQQLEEQLESMQREDVERQSSFEHLKILFEKSQETVCKFDDEIKEKQSRIAHLENTVSSLNETVQELEALKVVVFQRESEYLDLQSCFDRKHQENVAMNETLAELRGANESMLAKLEESDRKVSQLDEVRKKFETYVKPELEKRILIFQSSVDNLLQVKQDLEKMVESGKSKAAEHSQDLEILQHKYETSEKEIHILQYDKSSLMRNIDTLQSSNTDLLKQVDELQSFVDEQTVQREQFRQKCETIQIEKQSLIEENKNQIQLLQCTIDSLRSELNENTAQHEQLRQTCDENDQQMQSLHNNIESLQSKLEEKTVQHKQLQAKCKTIQHEKERLVQENKKQMHSLQSSIDSLQSEINAKNIQHEQLQKDCETIQIEKAHLMEENKQHVDSLNISIGSLQKELHEKSLQHNQLVTEKEHLEEENYQHIHSLHNNIDSLESELVFAKKEGDSNKQTIEELMMEIDSQLLKLKDKESELTLAKEDFSSRDLSSMQRINELNSKITNLEDLKQGLESELLSAKELCRLKEKELKDMEKSKHQLEKQLNKTINQHEKKIELMGLTIETLEAKVASLSIELSQLEARFADESQQVISLTAEKGKLAGKYHQTKNELTSLKQQLQTKETECDCKDDVIAQHTKELCALKLDIELKASELAECKMAIANLEKEKSAAVTTVDKLNEELDKLKKTHKLTLEELHAVTDMKTSMSTKINHFKDNMQSVFAHYEIKKKNLKQSLEELKRFKCTKEEEIKQLHSQLAEVRSEVEHLKEENHSIQKDLQNHIDTKAKEMKCLQEEVDALKTTEAGYLQETATLKEELNYTIDRYSEALALEKEQTAESDQQIQSITENLHDLLEKFNALDKEHKELTNVFEYNKKSFDELKHEKDCKELEMVRLKNEYEEDAKNCKREFETELGTLKKIEKSLKKDIEKLKAKLQRSTEEGATVARELQDSQSHLHIIQCEKAELANKLDQLELSNESLRKEYDNLKLAKEKYMKETKAALIEKQDLLEAQKEASEDAVAQKEKEISKLRKEVSKYSDRMKREEDIFRRDIEKRQKEIMELQTSIANFLQNIETLTKEKDILNKKIQEQEKHCRKLGETCDLKELKMLEQEKQLQNLHISHDVLEAGKSKMENMLKELEERLSSVENQTRTEKHQFDTAKCALQTQLEKAHAQIRSLETSLKKKHEEIDAANEEFDSVQSILTNMTKKMESTSRQLSVIHEDYEGKLKSERDTFKQLKSQYDTTLKEMEYIGGLNDGLKLELEEVRRDRLAAEVMIHEKEELIAEMQQKYESVANLVGAKDASIASLQAELANTLVKLEVATVARHALEDECRRTAARLAEVTAQREELIETHACTLRAVEENLLRTENEVRVVVSRLEGEQVGRGEIETLLGAEREAKVFLERRVVDLESKVFEANAVRKKLSATIRRFNAQLLEKKEMLDEEELDDIITETERKIIVIFGKLRDLENIKELAAQDKDDAQRIWEQMNECNQQLSEDKAKLLESYEKLHEEKVVLLQDKAKDSNDIENMKVQYEALQEQHISSSHLQQKLEHLEANNKQRFDLCTKFLNESQAVLKIIETLVSGRNQVEQVVCLLKDNYSTLQIKGRHITEELHKLHFEQKTALEIIIDDIYKQFRRLSKMIYNLNLKSHQIINKVMSAIMEDKVLDWSNLFKELNAEKISEDLEDLKDNVNNTQVQLEAFLVSIDALPVKDEKPRVLKENLQLIKQQPKEDEWRKKYFGVKQKLTLVENAKSNFERKIKELRDENKKLRSGDEKEMKVELKQELREAIVKNEEPAAVEIDNDAHYKSLLQEYIQLKQHYQDEMSLWTEKNRKLEAQLISSTSKESQQPNEYESLKRSYRDVKIAYSKLQLNYSALEQQLNEKNEQISMLTSSKDCYSTLCEENTNLKSEIDTLKYKRQRDREQYLQQRKKDESELVKNIQAAKAEYDLKLEKMKEKLVSTFKEQMDHNETQRYEKILTLKEENGHYRNTVIKLKEELGRAHAKNELLDSEKQYVMQQLKVVRERDVPDFDFKEPVAMSRRASSHSLHSEVRSAYVEERRSTFSLPRNVPAPHAHMNVIEELHIQRRTSSVTPDMEMEDEGDMFNNKYLHDLKSGRPSDVVGRESSNRLSELYYRNSLCPPHLKSSYAAETQFLDRQFKEEDIKSGNIDFLDDMKTHLLPSEKPKKKDAGTTSYKRPGPPTPSKHGGRLSLQGNERVLRENAEPKRNTPNPLRSLFSTKKVAASDGANGENAGSSPKKRPSLSFFRR